MTKEYQMSKEYRNMMYFVVATLHFYRKHIVEAKNVKEFREKNKKILDIVFKECLKYFEYELSFNQFESGIRGYIAECDYSDELSEGSDDEI